ncbi:chemotaxis protein CheB [Rhodopirellula bahusiensis]|uniref:chemotaxis protein CheB n=1 Tax=Rhodopirellula bahusiensis TaxID=2014065 RepID=UPI0032969B4B
MTTSPPTSSSPAMSSGRFPIVGIGASAGGVDALRRLLQAMPDDPPLAIVVIQHLARDRESLAPELLAKYTSMHLSQVDDEPLVKPGHVYLIPPGKYLRIGDGHLHLSHMEGPRAPLVTIDYFLRSLAEDQGQCAVGVVLSGSGSDGSLGIKAIKEAGGFVIAQDIETAEQTGMPESAIRTGLVDTILPPEKIPDALLHLAQHDYVCLTSKAVESTPDDPEKDSSDDLNEDPDQGLDAILAVVRDKTGRDFSSYKYATLIRRSRRRMCLHHTDSFQRYVQILSEDETEVRSLARDLLISVTDFFRDREVWDELAKRAIPGIVASKDGSSTDGRKNESQNTVRIWVPGCATGEEAYTVAMLAMDEIRQQDKQCQLQVFASDIDRAALQTAREGRYPTSIAGDLSKEQLRRYFVLRDGDIHYQVNQQLRDVVTFAEQDLIGDPPFSQLDLICCRNVMIYLKPSVQTKLLELFHFSLRDGGTLLLGTAETIGRQVELFEPLSKRCRIYRARGPKRPDRLPFPVGTGRSGRDLPGTMAVRRNARDAHVSQQQLLQMLAPRCILVDRELRIVYISGNVDDYLTFQSGTPSDDLMGKVRDGLRSRLRAAIQTALNEQRTVITDAHLLGEEKARPVRIEVRVIRDQRRSEPLALILFDPPSDVAVATGERANNQQSQPHEEDANDDDASDVERAVQASNSSQGEDFDRPIDESTVVRQLEQELAATKADLRLSIEQFESSNEEFKASTEEVMSINEELQSTNEELETSKEELQSLNEELSTVNMQLAAKVRELETKHADLENLISATNVATICLDTELLIRWFTEAAGKVIRVKPADIDRPLADLQNDFSANDLIDDCRQVLQTLQPVERESPCIDGRTFIRRVVPYRVETHRIGGLVITMLDISSRIAREQELWASEEKLRLAAQAAKLGWYSYDIQNDVAVWSQELRSLLGVKDDETINLDRALELVHSDDRQAWTEQVQKAIASPRNNGYHGEFRCQRPDGSISWLEDRGKVIWSDSSSGDLIATHAVGMVMDITERKDAEAQLRDSHESLEQQVADRTRVLLALQKLTRIANETVSLQSTVHAMIDRLAEFNGYQIGCVRSVDATSAETLNETNADVTEIFPIWHTRQGHRDRLAQVRQAHDQNGTMIDLHHQAVERMQPTWIEDLADHAKTEEVASLGIRSLVVAPVCFRNEAIATIALFASDPAVPSDSFRELLLDTGTQLGHAIERTRLQKVIGSIADQEQRRIGRELHDTIAQQLTGGALIARAFKESLAAEENDRHTTIDQLIQIFADAHRSVRELSAGLMHNVASADEIRSALESLCDEVKQRFDVGCELHASEFDPALVQSDAAAMAVVQIAREAIHNAVKHASSTQIDVELSTPGDRVRLVVADDGVGIAEKMFDSGGNGLRIMRFRAESLGGTLQINTPKIGGTTVIFILPTQNG